MRIDGGQMQTTYQGEDAALRATRRGLCRVIGAEATSRATSELIVARVARHEALCSTTPRQLLRRHFNAASRRTAART